MNLQAFYYINDNCIYDDNGSILNNYDKPPESLLDFCVNKTNEPIPENCNNIFDIILYMTNFKYNSELLDIQYEYSDNNYVNIDNDDAFSIESNEWINIE